MTIRGAAETALNILREIADGDCGATDPDVIAAIDTLERALKKPRAERRPKNRWGYRFGEPLRVTSGRLAGRTVEYVRACSSKQIYVAHNGARFAVQAAAVERAT